MPTRHPFATRRPGRAAALAAIACLGLAASPLAAQERAPQPAEKPAAPGFERGPLLAIERDALDRILIDPKDKALAAALAMVPQRLGELPEEAPDMPPQAADTIAAFIRTFARPARLTVAYEDENPAGGLFGYGVALSVLTGDREHAEAFHGRLTGLLAEAPNAPPAKPSTRFEGMQDIQSPVGLLSFGPRQARDGWRYEIIFGTMSDPDAGAALLPEPARGLRPFLRGRLDLAGFTPAVNLGQMLAGTTPQVQEVRKQLESLGLVGRRAMKVSFQIGHTETELVALAAVEGAGRYAEALGLPKEPIDRAHLAAIPADAVYATIGRTGGWLGRALASAKQENPEFAEGLAQFREMTGVDPEADILAALGDTAGFYMADSTGGGGLGSSVMMVAVRDRARLLGAFTRLAEFANTMAEEHAQGYIRLAVAPSSSAADMIALQFPGLPVPLEVTLALTDKWLLLAPTPQAAIVASSQARGQGDGGLPGNAAFAAAFPKNIPVTSVTFSDNARALRWGYTAVSMLGSAVANAVRSPGDPARSPGLTVPTYPELMKGVRASVAYATWRGDDYVYELHTDRSVVVNAGAAAGWVSRFMPIIIPAIAAAQNQEQQRRRGPDDAGEGALLDAPSRTGRTLLRLYHHALSPLAAERVAMEAAEPALP